MASVVSDSRNWAQWARNFRLWISIPFTAVGLLGIILTISEQSLVATISCSLIFVVNLVEVLGALNSRVEISETSVRVYGLLRNFEIEFLDIIDLKTERWDGGFYFIVSGPRWVKVLIILTIDGEIELDKAFGTKKRIAEFNRVLSERMSLQNEASD